MSSTTANRTKSKGHRRMRSGRGTAVTTKESRSGDSRGRVWPGMACGGDSGKGESWSCGRRGHQGILGRRELQAEGVSSAKAEMCPCPCGRIQERPGSHSGPSEVWEWRVACSKEGSMVCSVGYVSGRGNLIPAHALATTPISPARQIAR